MLTPARPFGEVRPGAFGGFGIGSSSIIRVGFWDILYDINM